MKKEASLLKYLMEVEPEAAKYWPKLVATLKSKDVIIPANFSHAMEGARFADEEAKRYQEDPKGFAAWKRQMCDMRYPGLSQQEISAVRGSGPYAASAAELADVQHHPKLMKVFHALCDELKLRRYGHDSNQYPRVILVSSDAPYAEIYSDHNDHPTIMMSTAFFELGSARMTLGFLLHELAHEKVNTTTGIKGALHSITKKIAPGMHSRWVEKYADKLPKEFGITGGEMADMLLQLDHESMKQTDFARNMRPLLQICSNVSREKPLPAFFHYLYFLENRSSLFLTRKHRTDTHPSTQERVANVLKGDDIVPSEKWRELLSGNPKEGGELIPYKPPGVGRV